MLATGYISLAVVISLIICFGYYYSQKISTSTQVSRQRRTLFLLLSLIAWQGYAALIGASGFIHDLSMPPRFPLLLIIPTFFFTALVLYRNRNSDTISAIPQSWPIYYQSFRIVIESLFIGSVAQNILTPEVTFEGYNYDLIFGISAPIVAFLVFSLKALPKRILIYWNWLGLVILASIIILFTTTIYYPSVWGHTDSMASHKQFLFPYVLVPAFLMPSAVFMHIFSLIQLRSLGLKVKEVVPTR